MMIGATGYGAGTRRLSDRPNVTVVTLGEPSGLPTAIVEHVVELETNLDDVTGETLAYTIAEALNAGALDAWTTPAMMKKGRPANILHVLAEPDDAQRIERLVLAETGSLGVRRTTATRTVLPRHTDSVDFDGCVIRIKLGPHGGKPEHDDVAAAAHLLGLPLRAVAQRALNLHARAPQQSETPEESP
jgi:uncharacterized protein (DUF111 family)